MLDVYDYSKAAANLRLKLADQENEALKEQLQALAAQTKARREALRTITRLANNLDVLDIARCANEAIALPDLATPILNKMRAEAVRSEAERAFNSDLHTAEAMYEALLRRADAIEKGE